MKSKKGVSPLIATVLIIGFTIVLAALVMQWGTGLFKSMQKSTEETSAYKLACATKLVGLDFKVKRDAGGIKVTIDNMNDYESLVGARFRAYSANGDSVALPGQGGGVAKGPGTPPRIAPYGTLQYTIPGGQGIKKLEAFPIIELNGEEKTCETKIEINVPG